MADILSIFLFPGDPLHIDMEIVIASFDSISEVNMVSITGQNLYLKMSLIFFLTNLGTSSNEVFRQVENECVWKSTITVIVLTLHILRYKNTHVPFNSMHDLY